MKVSDREVVAALGQALCHRIGEPRYRLWFHDKTKFCLEDGRLVVGVPNRFFQEWLQKTFAQDVQETAAELLGHSLPVSYTIDPELFQAFRRRENQEQGRPEGLAERVNHALPDGAPRIAIVSGKGTALLEPSEPRKSRTRRWRRLEEFVVGPCNRLAHASALSVTETPGEGPNPLVLHGPVGTGKTHLLEGVYLGLRKHQADARIIWLSAEDFTNRFVQAMRLGKLAGFRKQFREADALLVDDVHFLAKKLATQEEFLHTFDALVHMERPVILTCDCHPRLANQFMPELTDRLLGGAICGLNLPEKETRRDILRARNLRHRRDPLPTAVEDFLAEQLRGNVRELEGAMHTVDHYLRVTGKPLTVDLAREALAEVLRYSIRVVQLPDIERAVCSVLGLEEGALRNGQRSWMVSHPRMLAIYLARKHTAAAYTEIGQYLGGRNHSTAVAAEKKVRLWLEEDRTLKLGQRCLQVRDVLERAERELLR